MSKCKGVAGTLDAFIVRAESMLNHEIELTERRLSLDPLTLHWRSSLDHIMQCDTPHIQPPPTSHGLLEPPSAPASVLEAITVVTPRGPGRVTRTRISKTRDQDKIKELPVKRRRGVGSQNPNLNNRNCLGVLTV